MNKEYMLELVRTRIAELEKRYKLACSCKDDNGNDITQGAASAIRTLSKKDLQILMIMEQLLFFTYKDFFLDDDDLIEGFHRLVEPKERFRNKRLSSPKDKIMFRGKHESN